MSRNPGTVSTSAGTAHSKPPKAAKAVSSSMEPVSAPVGTMNGSAAVPVEPPAVPPPVGPLRPLCPLPGVPAPAPLICVVSGVVAGPVGDGRASGEEPALAAGLPPGAAVGPAMGVGMAPDVGRALGVGVAPDVGRGATVVGAGVGAAVGGGLGVGVACGAVTDRVTVALADHATPSQTR